MSGKTTTTHAENTRLVPNGKIYPLPKPKPTEKDNPLSRRVPTKKKGRIVKETRNNMYLEKGRKARREHPFLESDSGSDESENNENEEDTEDEGDCPSKNGCKQPLGDSITWVFCEGPCDRRWIHLVCEGIQEADLQDDTPYFCQECSAGGKTTL